jgi:hypothetical protein
VCVSVFYFCEIVLYLLRCQFVSGVCKKGVLQMDLIQGFLLLKNVESTFFNFFYFKNYPNTFVILKYFISNKTCWSRTERTKKKTKRVEHA